MDLAQEEQGPHQNRAVRPVWRPAVVWCAVGVCRPCPCPPPHPPVGTRCRGCWKLLQAASDLGGRRWPPCGARQPLPPSPSVHSREGSGGWGSLGGTHLRPRVWWEHRGVGKQELAAGVSSGCSGVTARPEASTPSTTHRVGPRPLRAGRAPGPARPHEERAGGLGRRAPPLGVAFRPHLRARSV